MKTLPEQARITASMIALGEHIAYGRDTELLMQLADKAEALTKERDAHRQQVEAQNTEISRLKLERDALAAAAKLALDFVDFCWRDVTLNEYAEDRRGNVEIALRQAGVQ